MSESPAGPRRWWSRRLVGAIAVLCAATVTVGLAVAPAAATSRAAASMSAVASSAQLSDFDHQLILLINQARANAGVPALTEATGLTQLSLWWSSQEDQGVNSYALAHNANAWNMLPQYGAANRTSWGENVAWSASTDTAATDVFDIYMKSTGHRANILSPDFRYVGSGTTGGAHGLFNTTEFTDAVESGQAVEPPVTSTSPGTSTPATTTPGTTAPVTTMPVTTTPVTSTSATPSTSSVPSTSTSTTPTTPTTSTTSTMSTTPTTPTVPVTTPVQTTPPIVPPVIPPVPVRLSDGTFIRDVSNGAVYRVAGAAPVYVSSWAAFGGVQKTVSVSHQQVLALPQTPAAGTFLRTPGSGAVYRIAGGAPIYVSSWAPFGGVHPAISVDPAAIVHAGEAGFYSHLRRTPLDGTFIRTPGSGAVYRLAGGAPIYVSSWRPFGQPQRTVDVDPAAVARSGQVGAWAHMTRYPVTVTYLRAAGQTAVYRVIDGKASHVLAWWMVGGVHPSTAVDPAAISKAGQNAAYSHLKR